MEILVKRRYRKDKYTIGDLYIDGEWFANTLEDKDRNLHYRMPLKDVKAIKVQDETAIPYGRYKVTLDVYSPKFGSREFYKEVCNGKLPRLLDVPGFEGILIHCGSGPYGWTLTSGCLLCGKNTIVGGLTESKESFIKIYNKLKTAKDDIWITITN